MQISRSRLAKLLVVSSLAACLALYFVEQVLLVNYLAKALAKIVFFIGIPVCFSRLFKTDAVTIRPQGLSGALARGSLKAGALLGLAAIIIIFASYTLLHEFLDLPAIALELQEKSQVTPANFLWIGLYITFGNSLLEEFFFRGFIFKSLYNLHKRRFAYWYSSLLFALYHIAIFKTWFSPWLIGLALIGLVSIGLIFNWLTAEADNFLNSWLAHMLADAAIMVIGLKMFALI